MGLCDGAGAVDSEGAKEGGLEAAIGAVDVVGDAVCCTDGAALGTAEVASDVGAKDGMSLSRLLGDTDGPAPVARAVGIELGEVEGMLETDGTLAVGMELGKVEGMLEMDGTVEGITDTLGAMLGKLVGESDSIVGSSVGDSETKSELKIAKEHNTIHTSTRKSTHLSGYQLAHPFLLLLVTESEI